MEKYLKQLKTLQDMVQTSKDFQKIMSYFMDNFATDPVFVGKSYETEDEILDIILTETGRYMYDKKEVDIKLKKFLTIDGYDFIHGFAFIEGRPMTIIYYPFIKLGAFVIADSPQSHFGRLRALPVTTSKQFPSIDDTISLN